MRALSDRIVTEIVKKYSKCIRKRAAFFAAHSLRSSLATSAAIAGASERAIQQQTGHKRIMVARRHIRDASLFRDTVAAKRGL
jgi:integrase